MAPIDHSILSPSGKVSKAARRRALERTRQELFGDGLPFPKCNQLTEAEILMRQAKQLRELAERGMKPRAYLKRAKELEERATELNKGCK